MGSEVVWIGAGDEGHGSFVDVDLGPVESMDNDHKCLPELRS
jgi:hypothetical protein